MLRGFLGHLCFLIIILKIGRNKKKGGVFSAGIPPALIMRRLACIRKLMGQRRFEVEFVVRQSKSLTDYQRVQMNVISQNCILAHIL